VTAWNQVFAIALLIWVFGWTGGKALVQTSYGQAKTEVQAQKDARAEKKAANKAAKQDGEPVEEA
jgi:hypothetical protein